jgi:hypothetical protein
MLRQVDPVSGEEAGLAGLSDAARQALAILDTLFSEGGGAVRKLNLPGPSSVQASVWVDACMADYRVSRADSTDSRQRAISRIREKLVEHRLILLRDDSLWTVGQ